MGMVIGDFSVNSKTLHTTTDMMLVRFIRKLLNEFQHKSTRLNGFQHDSTVPTFRLLKRIEKTCDFRPVIRRISSIRVHTLSVAGQPFASTTATASVFAGNAARLLWCQKSARTMTLKEFSIARRARHCNYVLIHFHAVTHS
jgi:hypothetical protein